MKKLLLLIIIAFSFACNEPLRVTTIPDSAGATSGTMGSVKAENQLPAGTIDTTGMGREKKDSLQ